MAFDLSSFFPELNQQVDRVYGAFTAIAAVLLLASLLLHCSQGALGNADRVLRSVLALVVQVLAIAVVPPLVDLIAEINRALVESLEADPSQTHTRFARLLVNDENGTEDRDLIDILFDDEGGLGKAILYAIIFLVAKVAWLIMWLGYVIQAFVLAYGVAVTPLFVALTGFQATQGISSRFFLSLLGVMAWPIGWALASLMTNALLNLTAPQAPGGDSREFVFSSQSVFLVLVVSLWILASTIATPRIISQMVQHGSQIGTSLLAAVGTGLSRGTSYAIGGGTTAAFAGGTPPQVAASTVLGGMGGFLSGASGSSGTIGSAAIGALALTSLGSSKEINQKAADIARHQSHSK